MMQGHTNTGTYTIHPINASNSFDVYCDMETDGGGWTVLLKRQDGSVNFQRNWDDYKRGFGNLEGEHWLGLDNMYLLTHQSSDPPQLRVDLADWEGNTAFDKYDQMMYIYKHTHMQEHTQTCTKSHTNADSSFTPYIHMHTHPSILTSAQLEVCVIPECYNHKQSFIQTHSVTVSTSMRQSLN